MELIDKIFISGIVIISLIVASQIYIGYMTLTSRWVSAIERCEHICSENFNMTGRFRYDDICHCYNETETLEQRGWRDWTNW